jgi:predicted nicotinamide N-methyase
MPWKKTKEEEEEDAVYADVGIMFEGSHASTLKHFAFNNNNNNSNDANIHIALKVVDDEPGAVQSGHYLWPAAHSLCEYLVQNNGNERPTTTILELGAGCALVSLVALQLYKDKLQCLVVTDHDPGTLERARDNHETTLEELYERAATEDEQLSIINELGSIPVKTESLEWGDEKDWKKLQEIVKQSNHVEKKKASSSCFFDLILGSDLIYCVEVVEPLLLTASKLLSGDGTFYLSQSFVYDTATEEEMDKVCQTFGLEREILVDDLSAKERSGVRIQRFRKQQKLQQKEEETSS